jgi:hypothetical protein
MYSWFGALLSTGTNLTLPFTIVGRRAEGRLEIYEHWQEMSIVQTRQAEKANRNVGDSVAKCQKRTATDCDVGLQTVQEMQ